MLPRQLDGGFHIVGHDDELRGSAVVIAAKSHDVDLSHGGRKIARKAGKSKRGSVRARPLFYCRTLATVIENRPFLQHHERPTPMLLRDHPLMSYRGLRSWPPVWTWHGGAPNIHPRGEIGILREVLPSNISPADRCFLHISHEGAQYVGCLLIEDPTFCYQIVKFLHGCCNRPIAEIGSLDISHPL